MPLITTDLGEEATGDVCGGDVHEECAKLPVVGQSMVKATGERGICDAKVTDKVGVFSEDFKVGGHEGHGLSSAAEFGVVASGLGKLLAGVEADETEDCDGNNFGEKALTRRPTRRSATM